MNCKVFSREIMLYHSDELPMERKSAVEAHLRECGSCSAFAAGILNMTANVRKLPRAKKRIDVWPRVSERLGRKPLLFPRLIVVPAAAALVLGMVFFNVLLKEPAGISGGDMEIVKEMEFLADFELWENLEALENVSS